MDTRSVFLVASPVRRGEWQLCGLAAASGSGAWLSL